MKNVIIIILSILVLSMGGYLVYDKIIAKDNNDVISENNDDSNNDVNNVEVLTQSTYTPKCNNDEPKDYIVYGDVSNYSNIFDYIANQKEVTIKLNYCTNEISSEGEAGIFYKTADYTLTSGEIENFLNEMKAATSKYLTGGNSIQCAGDLSITYKINGNINSVKINMVDVHVASSTDGNIYKIMDSNINETVPSYCLYSAGTSSNTINNIINGLK